MGGWLLLLLLLLTSSSSSAAAAPEACISCYPFSFFSLGHQRAVSAERGRGLGLLLVGRGKDGWVGGWRGGPGAVSWGGAGQNQARALVSCLAGTPLIPCAWYGQMPVKEGGA